MCCTYLILHSLNSSVTYVFSLLKSLCKKKSMERKKTESLLILTKVEDKDKKLWPILSAKVQL